MQEKIKKLQKEQLGLERIATEMKGYAKGPNVNSTLYSASIFAKYFIPGSILELGPAEGVMTKFLVSNGYHDITVIESSVHFCDELSKNFPQIKVVNTLFEEYKTKQKYNNIILGHVLEHVIDPVYILTCARKWLSSNGRIFVAVPNAYSLHRKVGVIMGLLKEEHELNKMDVDHGHRRVYDIKSLHADFVSANLKVSYSGSYWIKPLTNKQIEDSWSEELLNAYMVLGEYYPEIAAEIYIIAENILKKRIESG